MFQTPLNNFKMNNNEVLLLNANATPISWLPLSSISWQNAVRLIWLDVVEVLHTYDNWQVHSPSMTIEVPSVVMLRKQVLGFRNWIAKEESPQAHLVFLRDMFTCQYCLKQFARRHLTIDHVIPRVYGGKTHWSNVTSSCGPCNGRRGCNRRIRPASMPYRPTINQLIRNMRKFPIFIPHPCWNLYLNWDINRVHLVRQQRAVALNDVFDTQTEEFDYIA
jgi:5-methylcytosine-specific restriction endonuclease McrA